MQERNYFDAPGKFLQHVGKWMIDRLHLPPPQKIMVWDEWKWVTPSSLFRAPIVLLERAIDGRGEEGKTLTLRPKTKCAATQAKLPNVPSPENKTCWKYGSCSCGKSLRAFKIVQRLRSHRKAGFHSPRAGRINIKWASRKIPKARKGGREQVRIWKRTHTAMYVQYTGAQIDAI